LPLNSDFEAAYRGAFMTILPIIAKRRSLREERTILIRPLKRCSYCVRTVFIDSLYETGYIFMI